MSAAQSMTKTRSHAVQPPPPRGFWRRYIFSTDHGVIGKQYYFLALFSVLVAMILSWLMRAHLAWPRLAIPGLGEVSGAGAPGGVMTPEYYLSLVTMHGTLMIFFVLTTAPQSGFGNCFLPAQIGAAEMAFPRLNRLSFWLTFASLAVLLSSFFVRGGPATSGWTAYPPLSGLGSITGPGEGMGQNLWFVSIGLFCIASLAGAVNLITTTLDLRARGMTLMRMPLTCWAWFVTAILTLLSFAVLLAACILLMLDRMAGASFFIPGGLIVSSQMIRGHSGGSPLLWEHLFWFFGHPEVYIAILPGMGLTSHLLSCFSRKPVFGYGAMVWATIAIGFLGFLVWGHHMFVSGMNPYSAFAFSVLTVSIAVPSAVKTFNWLGTLWGGRLRPTTAMLFALGFVSIFVSGGLSGLFLAEPPVDVQLHATYFVVAHFHLVMGVAAIFGVFGGTYFWFPKMFGRMMNETLGKIHFILTFIGAYCVFMPMYFLGMAGNVRRDAQFVDQYLQPLMPLHRFITVAALVTGAVQLIFIFNLFWSMFRGEKAGENPWEATTLEWAASTAPTGEGRVVYRGPYEYGVPGRKKDYVMQDAPEGSDE
jgi:cytochrome c oxidase subunit 1